MSLTIFCGEYSDFTLAISVWIGVNPGRREFTVEGGWTVIRVRGTIAIRRKVLSVVWELPF